MRPRRVDGRCALGRTPTPWPGCVSSNEHPPREIVLEAVADPCIDVARRALERLIADPRREDIGALQDLLWRCDPALVEDVAAALRAVGDRDAARMAEARLRSDCRPAQRGRAARALGVLRDWQALPALTAAVGDANATVRAAALDALAEFGPDRMAARAAAVCVTDESADVRRRAVRAVGRLSPAPAWAVRAALDDPAHLVRREVAALSGRLPIPDVARLLTDDDPNVRATGAASAGPSSAHLLIGVLECDPRGSVRAAAAGRLGELGGDEAGEALLSASLADHDSLVRARALRLAERVLGRDRLAARLREEADGAHGAMALRALTKLGAPLGDDEAARLAHSLDPDLRLVLADLALSLVGDPAQILAVLRHDADAGVRGVATRHEEAEPPRITRRER